MLKKEIAYTDYNGVVRKETLHFNLTKAEITEMELSIAGGLVKKIEKIIDEQDVTKIITLFKEIILKAYGEKSDDGRRFIKSPAISEAFSQTEAYSDLFMLLATDAEAAAAFVNGIIPQEVKQN